MTTLRFSELSTSAQQRDLRLRAKAGGTAINYLHVDNLLAILRRGGLKAERSLAKKLSR